MRAELNNTFIAAAGDVLASETGLRVLRGPLSLERDAYVTGDVTVLISLVGDIGGIVFFSMALDTAKAILSTILGQTFAELNELARSGIGELANVMAGQATNRLGALGCAAQVSVPTLVVGAGSRISTLDIDRLVAHLDTELGTIRLDLALREAAANGAARNRGNWPLRTPAPPQASQ
jgi:chemotaxis protein CheX